MRANGPKSRFLDALALGPRDQDWLAWFLDVHVTRIHRLASRYRHLVERVDETPLSGPWARPRYALRNHPKAAP
jgi:hypothetical protein